MKPALLFALLFWQVTPGSIPVIANPQYLRYQRAVTVAGDSGQSCAVVDPQIFPHAAPSLKDLRLYQDGREVPYAITLSVPQQPDSDTGRVRNLGLRGRDVVFDLEMPNRPYTEITLDLAGKDFLRLGDYISAEEKRTALRGHHHSSIPSRDCRARREQARLTYRRCVQLPLNLQRSGAGQCPTVVDGAVAIPIVDGDLQCLSLIADCRLDQ